MSRGEHRVKPVPPPEQLLPLVRHLSRLFTLALLRTPLRANHVTGISILVGYCAAWAFFTGAWNAGALLFALSFILDAADGELARVRSEASEFGARLDDFGDWSVHSALFLALGWSASQSYGSWFWLACGAAAALGITIENAFQIAERRAGRTPTEADTEEPPGREAPWRERAVYVFRVLMDADFWLFVLILVLGGGVPVLLLGGAIGSNAYWIVALRGNARRFHV